jgi:hypothetical protein
VAPVPSVTIDELTIADEPATWASLGFALDGDVCRVGGVPIRLAGRAAGRGLVGWTLRGASSTELDGLPTQLDDGPTHSASTAADHGAAADDAPTAPATLAPGPAAAVAHPNGVTSLDHVVAITPALERTVAALQAAGLDLRRVREEPTPAGAPRQAFFRLGEAILEVVQEPDEAIERRGGPDRPAFFWGLAFIAPDLDATVAHFGDHASTPRPAVQPGRRIATLRRSAGLALPVALMTE